MYESVERDGWIDDSLVKMQDGFVYDGGWFFSAWFLRHPLLHCFFRDDFYLWKRFLNVFMMVMIAWRELQPYIRSITRALSEAPTVTNPGESSVCTNWQKQPPTSQDVRVEIAASTNSAQFTPPFVPFSPANRPDTVSQTHWILDCLISVAWNPFQRHLRDETLPL